MERSFHTQFNELPDSLPIFPLSNALLLPGGLLPLNIFEPRYLNMMFDALAGGRLIGLVQPDPERIAEDENAIYQVGCAGRITSFMEVENKRLLVTLLGITRFQISEEVSCDRGYRRIIPDWKPFRKDFEKEEDVEIPLDRERVIIMLKHFFDNEAEQIDWDLIFQMPAPQLINFLSMNLPLNPEDKQALLEADSIEQRAKILIALTDMFHSSSQSGTGGTRH